MSPNLHRREFIKFSTFLPLTFTLPGKTDRAATPAENQPPNVLVIVFDTLSALHLDIHGYERVTGPNFNRFAQRASVYHNHFAGGNFTTPGTASLLTGNYPWTHRAYNYFGSLRPEFRSQNIFALFPDHYRIAFSHNAQVNNLLNQAFDHLNYYKPRQELYLDNNLGLNSLFSNDYDNASISLGRILTKTKNSDVEANGFSNSLFVSNLYETYKKRLTDKYSILFPRGLPNTERVNYFLLEDAIDWVQGQLAEITQPFLGYFHFMPPHSPYNTRGDFAGAFLNDGLTLPPKPEHLFTMGRYQQRKMDLFARDYDEFILYADGEFGRLLDWLEDNGMMDNTWVVLTSDHGELFERGIWGHITPAMYQSLTRIPLMIHAPGQQDRQDIISATSAVDVLPTLAQAINQSVPDWAAGVVLPPFQNQEMRDRPIFTVEAKGNERDHALNHGAVMMLRNTHKLTYYFGYQELDAAGNMMELYDLEHDPEELRDLSKRSPQLAAELRQELLRHLQQAEASFK